MELSERISVMVEVGALERGTSRSASILGPVWLRHDSDGSPSADFPETRWSDFVVVILGWWLEGIAKLRRGAEEAELRFMDGPLLFRVAHQGPKHYRVQCIRSALDSEDCLGDWRTTKTHFDASLYAAGRTVLAECNRREWKSRDIDVLHAELRSAGVQVVA